MTGGWPCVTATPPKSQNSFSKTLLSFLEDDARVTVTVTRTSMKMNNCEKTLLTFMGDDTARDGGLASRECKQFFKNSFQVRGG